MTPRSRALTAILAPLSLAACFSGGGEPFAVQATLEPASILIPEAKYTLTPPKASFTIENTGGSTIYIAAAVPKGEMADLLTVGLPAYTDIAPEQTRPLNVSIDGRTWRWETGGWSATMPFEISYFYSGQDPDEPDTVSSKAPAERIVEVFDLIVDFTIDCDLDDDGVDAVECGGRDCDDRDPEIFPGQTETCDGTDEDCDGAIDEFADDRREWFFDFDRDGAGDPATRTLACDRPGTGWIFDGGDCDDDDALSSPSRVENCSELDADNDCDNLLPAVDPDCD